MVASVILPMFFKGNLTMVIAYAGLIGGPSGTSRSSSP
jgi:hypothetical protein